MMSVVTIFMDVIFLGGLSWWLYKRQSAENKIVFSVALAVKSIAGMMVGWLYFIYYHGQGDTISYWQDGTLIAKKLFADPGSAPKFFWTESPDSLLIPGLINDMPRSFFFSKISGILALLSSGNYWLMSAMLSLISFLAAWYLFLKTVKFFPLTRVPAAISFLFFPSVVFWSSGLVKETLGLASIFFLTGLLFTSICGGKVRVWEWIVVLLAIWIGWSLKYYWMGIYLPMALTVLAVAFLKKNKPQTAKFDLAMGLGFFCLLMLVATNIHPNFNLSRLLDVTYENNLEFMASSDPQNVVRYSNLNPSLYSAIVNAPQAAVAGFFRPFIWEVHNLVSGVAGLENLAVLALALFAIPGLRGVPTSSYRLLIVGTLVYCLLLAIFLSLSTPNLGTLSRYKIGFMPFFLFLALYQNPVIAWFQRRIGLGH